MSQRPGLYLRVSEDRSGEGLAVDRQREDCGKLVGSRGWGAPREFSDNDTSAAGRKKRPGFLALLQAVRDHEIDVIVAWSLDRLVRTARDRLHLVETCREHGVSVVLVRGSDMDLTTAAGRLYLGVLGEVAQHEIDVKSERHIRAARQAAEAGLPHGGRRAFGYQRGGRELHPTEAAVVGELYHRFLSGAGLVELAEWLHHNGWRTPVGNRWRMNAVKAVLANPRNCGKRGFRPVVDQQTGRRAYWHDIISDEAVWPAIVDEATWRATMKILQDPSRRLEKRTPGPVVSRHLLSGIATCGLCGLPMISSSSDGARIYKCSSKMHLTRRAVPLETWVEIAVLKRLQLPGASDLLAQQLDAGPDLSTLKAEVTGLRVQLDQYAVDYADGLMDRDQLRAANARTRGRLQEAEDRIAAAGRVDVVAPLVGARSMEAARGVWRDSSMSVRREVLTRLVRIEVFRAPPGRPKAGVGFDPSTVRLTWRS